MLDDRIRTSDADREQVAARLRDHYAEGRLTQEEFDERLTTALSAKTFGELRQVMTDLPGPKLAAFQPKQPSANASSRYRPPVMFRRRPRVFPLLVLALLAILLFSGAGAAVLAVKVVAIIAMVMFLAFAAVAVAGALFFRQVRKHWQAQQFGNEGFGAWADRFGPGQLKFQSWEWPPRHGHRPHHHHHDQRWSRESDDWQS
ncbi:MAG TPA: DUF1707 domain-containing protein [Streptosporangiaceae bacterium]|jgi:hypothetical protein